MKSATRFALLTLTALTARVEAADVANGERQYFEFGCYGCHGYNGTGERPLVPAASIGALGNEAVFLRYLRLRADQNPINPKRTMPNYSARTLSDDDARDIYAYLWSLEDSPPPVEDIPALQALLDDARDVAEEETENR